MKEVYHRQLVDYIRCTSVSMFGAERNVVAISDIRDYEDDVLHDVCEYLCIVVPDLLMIRRGHYGYRIAIPVIRGIVLYAMPFNPNMGVCVQISGEGMDTLRIEAGWSDIELISKLSSDGFRFSRIDMAIDTYKSYTTAGVVRAVQSGVKAQRQKQYEKSVFMYDIVTNAMTLYLGSRTSERFGRIYDKSLVEGEIERRTRYELEYKKDRAEWIVTALIAQGWPAVVSDMIDFAGVDGVTGFPSRDNIDTAYPVSYKRKRSKNGKSEWVERCISAIVIGIREMGVTQFKDLANREAGFDLLPHSGDES